MALEVIGPGFGRTGTNSLKLAIEHLGFGPCHHMFEVRDNPDQLPHWERAARGEKMNWDTVFQGYRSQVDWPGARYWRELVKLYPKAKVILSVRDPDEWHDSVKATILQFLAARGKHPSPHVNAICEMGHETVDMQEFGGRLADREHAKHVFNKHIGEVKAEIPAERLLVFDLREGWGPLCAFLGVCGAGYSISQDQFVEGVHRRGMEAGVATPAARFFSSVPTSTRGHTDTPVHLTPRACALKHAPCRTIVSAISSA